MENLIIEDICKGKKWYERVRIKISKKSHIEAYKLGRKDCFNYLYRN